MKKVITIRDWVSEMRLTASKRKTNILFVRKDIWLKLAGLMEQQDRMINELTAIVNWHCEQKDWIPCDEGHPGEDQVVYLTFKNDAGIHAGEAIYKQGSFYYVTDTVAGYYEEEFPNPIAWQPTPKPYRG